MYGGRYLGIDDENESIQLHYPGDRKIATWHVTTASKVPATNSNLQITAKYQSGFYLTFNNQLLKSDGSGRFSFSKGAPVGIQLDKISNVAKIRGTDQYLGFHASDINALAFLDKPSTVFQFIKKENDEYNIFCKTDNGNWLGYDIENDVAMTVFDGDDRIVSFELQTLDYQEPTLAAPESSNIDIRNTFPSFYISINSSIETRWKMNENKISLWEGTDLQLNIEPIPSRGTASINSTSSKSFLYHDGTFLKMVTNSKLKTEDPALLAGGSTFWMFQAQKAGGFMIYSQYDGGMTVVYDDAMDYMIVCYPGDERIMAFDLISASTTFQSTLNQADTGVLLLPVYAIILIAFAVLFILIAPAALLFYKFKVKKKMAELESKFNSEPSSMPSMMSKFYSETVGVNDKGGSNSLKLIERSTLEDSELFGKPCTTGGQ